LRLAIRRVGTPEIVRTRTVSRFGDCFNVGCFHQIQVLPSFSNPSGEPTYIHLINIGAHILLYLFAAVANSLKMETDFHHDDSESAKSPIGNEKIRHVPLEAIPDPDDGLSAEERAKIVPTSI
jgi:hypothetical protein